MAFFMSNNNINNALINDAFLMVLEVELKNASEGITEYNLIQKLKAQGYPGFSTAPALPENIFQVHFILFHALYLLRDKFINKKSYLLNIDTLNIRLNPYKEGSNELGHVDNLRSYYLDLNNLENTSTEDVYDLLASFWNKINKLDNREEALAELGLTDPVNNKAIKQAYRKLAMQHHPDRGGEADKLQKINDALALLLG